MFSNDSHLNHIDLDDNDFSVPVSEKEEQTIRNHLKSFDYTSCQRDFKVLLDETPMSPEVFRPLMEMLKFNVKVVMSNELNNDSFKEEIREKAIEWNEGNTRDYFRKIIFNSTIEYAKFFENSSSSC